ncbi:MAG TPA: FxsA family protein [Candidatus Brocadiia bacterium]|nr:FxsA family protein [Candidatus Brocadiia bacterium]
MLLKLILLMTLVPVVELVLLVKIAQWSGSVWVSVGIVLLTGAAGAWLAKNQGLRTIRLIQEDLATGRLPTDRILDGMIILAGAILLLTPGVLTDALGILLLIPPTRTLARAWIKLWAQKHFKIAPIVPPVYEAGSYDPEGPEEIRDVEAEVK